MNVITVTEARVVAFFISSRLAPIANPSPCKSLFVEIQLAIETSTVNIFVQCILSLTNKLG